MQSKEGSVKINAVKNAQYDFLQIEGPRLVKVSIFNNVLSYKKSSKIFEPLMFVPFGLHP